jgi:hypothetical protein
LASLATVACADLTPDKSVCEPNSYQCSGRISLKCTADGTGLTVAEDCGKKDLVCTTQGCLTCGPGSRQCQAEKLVECNSQGTGFLPEPIKVCDISKGDICDSGLCVNACQQARENRSYVGCEYWAADLDNAVVDIGAAAAQQFALAVSNPSPLAAEVKITINEAAIGEEPKIKVVTERTVKPQVLEIILLPPREVDGSPPGQFNAGTGTALTNAAYKIESSAPIIVYQFNPLSNVGVFSNDASLLVPVSALALDSEAMTGSPYLVMAWPQTIANTDDRFTNFGTDLRAFLTIVATRDSTNLRINLTTDIIGDGPTGKVPATKKGQELIIKLEAYQVLNLETAGFGADADFTGTRIDTDKPVAVFSGSEASDVPDTPDLTFRQCCADHLEEQLLPLSTLGRAFIAIKTPSRTKALSEAGATIQVNEKEKEYFRILAAGEFTGVSTNLPKPDNALSIQGTGFARLEVDRDFTIQANGPIVVGQFVAGQQSVGIPSSLPGGDPSFMLLPPVEQFRKDYLFLTPNKYAFDFIMIAAPENALLKLDGRELKADCDTTTGKKICCTTNPVGAVRIPGDQADTSFVAYKCQLSFPVVVENQTPPNNLQEGLQNDGVHRLTADVPVGLVVYGFDAYVSYGYLGGTDLELINLK